MSRKNIDRIDNHTLHMLFRLRNKELLKGESKELKKKIKSNEALIMLYKKIGIK